MEIRVVFLMSFVMTEHPYAQAKLAKMSPSSSECCLSAFIPPIFEVIVPATEPQHRNGIINIGSNNTCLTSTCPSPGWPPWARTATRNSQWWRWVEGLSEDAFHLPANIKKCKKKRFFKKIQWEKIRKGIVVTRSGIRLELRVTSASIWLHYNFEGKKKKKKRLNCQLLKITRGLIWFVNDDTLPCL